MLRIILICLPLALAAQTPGKASENWVQLLGRLEELPELQSEQAGLAELSAERDRIRASQQPQVQLNLEAGGSTNPVGVFAGKLGNQDFGMSDFAIPTSTGGFDTFPVNHPDPFWDGALSLQAGMRLWDGGERKGWDRHFAELGISQELRIKQAKNASLLQYLSRRILLDSLMQRVARAKEQVEAAQGIADLFTALVQEGQAAPLNLSLAESGLAHARAIVAGLEAEGESVRRGLAHWLGVAVEQVDGLPLPRILTAAEAMRGEPGRAPGEEAAAAFAEAQGLLRRTVAPLSQPIVEAFADLRSHQLSAENWTLGVKASWKLWDGHERRARLAKYEAQGAKARAEQARVEAEFAQARSGLAAQLAVVDTRLEALSRASETAKSAWENHKALLEEGQLDQGGVFESRRIWLEYEQQLLAARAEAQILCWRALSLRSLPLTQWLNKE